MPGPPTEIRIKRKATDDPVELLHVQNEFNGIRQVKQYVFKRQRISTIPNNSVSFTGAQSVAGLENPQPAESLILKNGHVLATSQGETLPIAENGGLSAHGGEGKDVPKARSAITGGEPRRFHLSRDTTSNPAGRIRGAKGPPAVFIERRRLAGPRAKLSDVRTTRKPGPKPEDFSINQKGVGEQKTRLPSSSTETQSSSTAPLRNVRLPSGKVIPWDVDSSTLAAEMQAYTLKEIGRNLAEASTSENLSASTSVIRAMQVSSFKPKAPALRYHERHPEQTGAMNEKKEYNQDEIMADAADVDGDESDYVMETYVRMPAEMFDLQEQKNVGVLVLDSQPDIDDFYNDDSDTDSEIYDEEEDENAENHPSTDYPEDEVESDDEYGRNPYKFYRNHNASDNEEYDADDVTYSDDDEAKLPWGRRPWMRNGGYDENVGGEEDNY